MDEKHTPLGALPVPRHIVDGLLADAKLLRANAERVAEILDSPESYARVRLDEQNQELHRLLEQCLAAVVNLSDYVYPTRPRVDLSLGYEFHSGPVGFIVGGDKPGR